MSSSAPLTEAQVQQLAEWIDEGRTHSWIADQLGISTSGVGYHRARLGMGTSKFGALGLNPRAYVRAGKIVRPFTPEEDGRILAMRVDGHSLSEIATAVGRGDSSIVMRLIALARRDEMAA